jgi:hypothetical protein
VVFQQNSVVSAQRSSEIAMTQYREGAVDYQRVLDAQRSLLQQQNDLAQAGSSVATNVIALYKALGGGWEFRRGQPFVNEPTKKEMEDRTGWSDLLTEASKPETSAGPPSTPSKQNPPPPAK